MSLRGDQAACWLRENYGAGSTSALAVFAWNGGGPSYRKYGRTVLYEVADLRTWAESRLSHKTASTSELKEASRAVHASPQRTDIQKARSINPPLRVFV